MAFFYKKDLDTIIGDDFDRLIDGLEAKGMNDYNYHKVTKKFFKWHTNDDVPKWVRQVRLPHEETPVQSSDLLNEQHKPEPEDNQTEASSIDMEHSFYKPMVKHSPMQR